MDQREPIELPVEHISNEPASEPASPFVFQVQFGNWEQPPREAPLLVHRSPPRRMLPLILFAATCVSTFLVGGLEYSAALMAILVAHEMGHFLQARRYGVPASWPWFIPMPISPLGTMGAVIVQSSGYADRKQMFDIGITGPLAGLVLAIPITIWGLQGSRIENLEAFGDGLSFGNPPLLLWLAEWHFGKPLLPNQDFVLTPLLFAGWVGILITALNLIPIGQLDGGHILYGLICRRAHSVARLLLSAAVIWTMATGNWSYSVMIFLMLTMGVRHPPTRDDSVPLGPFRIVLGWLTLAFVLIGFTPNPISLHERPPREQPAVPQPATSSASHRHRDVPQIEKRMRDHDRQESLLPVVQAAE